MSARRLVRLGLATLLSIAVAAYIVIAALLTLKQDSLIYPAPKYAASVPAGLQEITYRTEDGLDLRAGYRPASAGKPVLLFFHGNGGNWQSSVAATELLTAAGYGLLATEYRGFSGNPGSPNEQGLYRDGRAAVQWLAERGIAPSEIVLMGNSIGSGVATQMATEDEFRALMLVSPFTSLPDVVDDTYWWLPVRLLMRDRYDNLAKIASVAGPVMVLHGDADGLIPVGHARQLVAARAGTELVVMPGRGHQMAWEPDVQRRELAFLQTLD